MGIHNLKTLISDEEEDPRTQPSYYERPFNSLEDLREYFGVSVREFMEFWDTLIWPEKQDFIWADLSGSNA
jgi:hypothetical protein